MAIRRIEAEARDLYEDPNNGLNTLQKVADRLKLSLNTIKTYSMKARKAGRPWKKPPMDLIVRGNVIRASKPGTKHSDALVTTKNSVTNKRKTKVDPAAVVATIGTDILEEVINNDELTDQEVMFAIYYIGSFNAKGAAVKAGYPVTTAAHIGINLLNKPVVRDEINRLKEIYAYKAFIDIDRVINKHIKIAFSDMGDFVEYGYRDTPVYNQDGEIVTYEEKPYFKVKPIDEVDSSLIKSVREGKYGIELTLEERSKSLEFLGRLLAIPSKLESEKLNLLKKRLDIDSDFTAEKILDIIKSLDDNELEKFGTILGALNGPK